MSRLYFDIIPNEVTEMVYFKVYHLSDILKSVDVVPVLKDYKFWRRKIDDNFPYINLEYVPSHLYDFRGFPVEVMIANFGLLKRSYDYATKLMLEHQSTVSIRKIFSESPNGCYPGHNVIEDYYHLSGITNFKILKFGIPEKERNTIPDELLIGNFVTYNRSSIRIVLYDDERYEFDIKYLGFPNSVYPVTKRNAFDALLHINCNGAPQVLTF